MQNSTGNMVDEARYRKNREEILQGMEQALERMREERVDMERRLDKQMLDAEVRIEQIVEKNESAMRKIEDHAHAIHKETVSTLYRLEDRMIESVDRIEKRVDLSGKSIQTMTMVAAFGFLVVTLAVLVLFFALLTNL